MLIRNTRFSETAAGVVSRDLPADEVCEALHRDIGLAEDLIEDRARSGSLSDSLQPLRLPGPRSSLANRHPGDERSYAACAVNRVSPAIACLPVRPAQKP